MNLRLNEDIKINNKNKNIRFGEIINEDSSLINGDIGMPFRGSYSGKKQKEILKSPNDRDVFNVSNDNNEDYNISYNDPTSPDQRNYSELASIGNKLVPELHSTENSSLLSMNVNKYGLHLFKLVLGQLNKKFCIASLSIYNIFGILYYASNNMTEINLADYFSFMDKENSFSGLSSINELLINNKQYIMKDLILINNKYEIIKEYTDHVKNIVNINYIDPEKYVSETIKINKYLYKYTNGKIHNLSEKIIENGNILCINAGIIKPIFKTSFDKIINTPKHTYIGITNSKNNYYEDIHNQYIEILCHNNLVLGLIKSKHKQNIINIDMINTAIQNMKQTILHRLLVPLFEQKMKIKLTNLLYNDGLKSLFDKAILTDLLKSHSRISDIVQNITFSLLNNINNITNINNNQQINSTVNFIIDTDCIYYIRLVPTNTIILIGYYDI